MQAIAREDCAYQYLKSKKLEQAVTNLLDNAVRLIKSRLLVLRWAMG